VSIHEFSQKNIGNLKDFKSTKLDKSKTLVETIHKRLKDSRRMENELVSLQQIE